MDATGVMLDVVYELHDARTLTELESAALHGLRRTVGLDLASWTTVDLGRGELSAHCEPEPLPVEFTELADPFTDIPFIRTLIEHPTLKPTTLSEVAVHGEAYLEVARSVSCGHQIQVVVAPLPGGGWQSIAGSRPDRDFDDHDRARLGELVRHVRQARTHLTHRRGDIAQAGLGAGLSTRQAEALQAVADGATMPVASARLGVAPRTLENHLQAAYRRLGVNSRLAALHAVRHAE